MTSTFGWASALVVSVAAVAFGAWSNDPGLQMTLAAAACLSFALLAVVQRRRLAASGANAAALSSATATAMAVVWLWAAATLLVTYVFISTWASGGSTCSAPASLVLSASSFPRRCRAMRPPAARMRRCSTLPATSRSAS